MIQQVIYIKDIDNILYLAQLVVSFTPTHSVYVEKTTPQNSSWIRNLWFSTPTQVRIADQCPLERTKHLKTHC